MPETRFIEFTALSIDPRVGIFQSALETDAWLFFLSMALQMIEFHSSFHLIYEILRRTTIFYECHSVFFVVAHKWRHFWNLEFWRHFERRV